MKISITEKELKTLKEVDGVWQYRLNKDMVRSGFKTKEEAIADAEKMLIKYLKQRL
jgi:hypothetical protein